jgi:uncharacterized protein (DUF1330 family)
MGESVRAQPRPPLSAFRQRPVFMLNLLQFNSGGEEGYLQYSAAVEPLLKLHGARVIFAGRCVRFLINDGVEDSGVDWDLVAVVRYPSLESFKAMISSAAYQEILPLREQALKRSVLCATDEAAALQVPTRRPSPKL